MNPPRVAALSRPLVESNRAAAEGILGALAAVLAPMVARELAARNAPTHYSTATPAEWPPGARSKRAARERIRAVSSHEHIANVWRVDVEAYRAHYTHRRARAPIVAPTMDDEALATAAIEAAGLRATRKTA